MGIGIPKRLALSFRLATSSGSACVSKRFCTSSLKMDSSKHQDNMEDALRMLACCIW